MQFSIISFTENGIKLSAEIVKKFGNEKISVFTKWSHGKENKETASVQYVNQNICDWAGEQMKQRQGLLFIGACGIAVRAIAPFITDKLQDSPVLVMDEKGTYIIPILSGHMGGANEFALQLAEKLGAIPVITTATDINGRFAVDMFAKRNGLYIANKDGIAKVSSKVLAGAEITMSIEPGHINEAVRINGSGHINEPAGQPEGIKIVSYPPKQCVDVVITSEEKTFDALLCLKPKEYVIGMGCKKGREADKIEDFIERSMKEAGITKSQIFALASIDKKKEEEGLLIWSRKEKIPFLTFSAEQLQKTEGNFSKSAFVKEQVGVDNVCERAALSACGFGGIQIYGKHAEDGMTIAIAKRDWSVSFDEK